MSKVRNWKTASFQFLLQNTTRTNRLERTRINIISCFHNANRLITAKIRSIPDTTKTFFDFNIKERLKRQKIAK